MKEYIEERAINIANYIIDYNATVRQTAKEFGVSKSTVHMNATIQNGLSGQSNKELNLQVIWQLGGFYFFRGDGKLIEFSALFSFFKFEKRLC